MVSEKEKNYRLLKRVHVLPSIIGLIFMYAFMIIIAWILVDLILDYLCDNKLESEYKTISYMASLYEKDPDKDDAEAFLATEGRDYIITDNENNVIYRKGEDTCSYRGGMAEIINSDNKVQIYYDNNDKCLELSDGKLDVKFSPTFKIIKEKGIIKSIFSSDEQQEDFTIPMYFWITVDFSNGRGKLIGKASYDLKLKEVVLVLGIILVLAIVAVALYIALIIRIIKKYHRRKQILKVFFTDDVTLGHNWMWFTIKNEQMLRKKKNDRNNYAILNIEFVKYNTFCVCHSVEEGIKALQAINRTILKSIQKTEDCAHHGLSSFAVLMQYADEAVLKKKIQFILRKLEGVEKLHKFAFHVGIALLPAKQLENGSFESRKDIDIEKVYNNACAATATLEMSDDSAIAFFDDKLVEEQRWIDIVNEKQQQAVDNEEFVIYYQPKYNPKTNELKGAEALIRWQSPEFGFVTPGRIIPIYEKNGFITEIDHYMLKHVARDQKRWLDAGFKCVPISVNVSRAHFIESDLAEQIRDTVDNEGAPRELIEIELTESAFFDDKKALISIIERLKSYGFIVSMDDFGAGYSSLNSLKDMPLDVLKLDADFFRGESEGGRGEKVVSEVIRLAKVLDMHTVAEGVEDKDQVDFLAKLDCDMIQGYYYAKPMPGADYEDRMIKAYAENAENATAEGVHLLEAPAAETMVKEATVAETATEEEPVVEYVTEDVPAAEKAIEEPVVETPEEESIEEVPAEEVPAAENVTEEIK